MAETKDGSESENLRLRELAIRCIISEGGEAMLDEAFESAKQDIKNDAREMEAIQQLIKNYKEGLRAEAISRLKKDVQDVAFIAALMDTARNELLKDVVDQLTEELQPVVRPIVEQQLKVQLMNDPDFVAQVKAELKKTILGL